MKGLEPVVKPDEQPLVDAGNNPWVVKWHGPLPSPGIFHPYPNRQMRRVAEHMGIKRGKATIARHRAFLLREEWRAEKATRREKRANKRR